MLPLHHRSINSEVLEGFEPSFSTFVSLSSIQLNYKTIVEKERLELSHITAPISKTDVSTNSTISRYCRGDKIRTCEPILPRYRCISICITPRCKIKNPLLFLIRGYGKQRKRKIFTYYIPSHRADVDTGRDIEMLCSLVIMVYVTK